MSTLLTLFRRLLFQRRSSEATKSNESDKTKKRTKSLSSPNTTSSDAGSSMKRKTISIGRSGSIVIRNRSQTESVTVERKHVHRSTEKNPFNRSSSIVRPLHIKNIQITCPTQTAPTLTPSYSSSRMRSISTSKPTSTIIHIKT